MLVLSLVGWETPFPQLPEADLSLVEKYDLFLKRVCSKRKKALHKTRLAKEFW